MPLPKSRLHSACSLHDPRVHTHAHAHAHIERPDVLSELLAPRVCHPPARSGQRRGRERRHRAHRTGVDDRAAREKARLDSNTGLGRKQSACAKKAPPIPLVTDATADLPAPIFLIAASPIVIRQGYFKRLRLIYLFPTSFDPVSSTTPPTPGQSALIHSWQTSKTGAHAYFYYTDL